MSGFWSEDIWLPIGTSWSHLKSNETIRYPAVHELQYTIYFGFALLVYRVLLESFVFVPLGWITGWVTTPLVPRIFTHLFGGFMGRSKLKRVSECGFRFSYYLMAWIAGFLILRNEPQFNDVTECWRNWPHHNVSDAVWWYYIIETSFYWCLFIGTLFLDVRRADFYQMLSHHAITIGLLYISWSMNMTRVGSLVLLIHDAADIFIELAKILRYARYQRALAACFVVLFTTWVATRIVIYPFWILRSIWVDAPDLIQKAYRWRDLLHRPIMPRVLMVLLSSLLLLHIFWTCVLLKCALEPLRTGGEMDDIREQSDSEEEDEEDEKKPLKEKTN